MRKVSISRSTCSVIGKKERDAKTPVVSNHVAIDKVKQWSIVVIGRDPHTFVTQYNPWPKNCQIIEITGQEDFSAGIGYKKCLNAIKDNRNVVLFMSLPHSGGHAFDIGCNRVEIARSEIGMHYDKAKLHRLWVQYERLCNDNSDSVGMAIR